MKRKIFSVFLALVLVLSFSLVTAVPAGAEPGTLNVIPFELGYTTNAMAEWRTEEEVHSGSYSTHLVTTGSVGSGNEGRIVIDAAAVGIATLGDITSLSWWVYTVAGYPSHVDITLDTADVDQSQLTAEMAYNNADGKELDEDLTPTLGQWLQTFELSSDDEYGEIDNSTMFWVTKMGAGDDDAPSGTLADWKAGTVANDPGSELSTTEISESTEVLYLEIEVDNWVLLSEAYVDDIEINGTTYYGLIQDAVDSAVADDIISVAAGTYDEYVNINESLTLSGQPGAIVKPSIPVVAPIIGINADGVTVEGFEVDGSLNTNSWAGIGTWNNFTNFTIKGNTVHDILTPAPSSNPGLGIGLWRGDNTAFDDILIEGNTVYNTSRMGIYVGASGGGPDPQTWLLSNNITIRDNVVHDTMLNASDTFPLGCGGISVDAAKGSTVEGNTVYNTGTVTNLMPGIFLNHGSGPENQISGNEVYNQAYGIAVVIDGGEGDVEFGTDLPTAPKVHFNNIHDNSEYGLIVLKPAGKVVDATNNWWGAPNGPGQDGANDVSGDVAYSPWLGATIDVSPMTFIVDDVGPEPAVGYIQAAIDAALANDTVSVAAGTYREYLHITTDGLTIEGAGIDESIIDLDGLTPYWHYTGGSYASRGGVLITPYGQTAAGGNMPDGDTELIEDVTFKGFTVKNAGLNPPITATGTHTGSDNAPVLTDASASWTPDALIGNWVHNMDDSSGVAEIHAYGQITANTETTVTAPLSAGDENDWDNGDHYIITPYEGFYDPEDDGGQDNVAGINIGSGKNITVENCKIDNSGTKGIRYGEARRTDEETRPPSENPTIIGCTIQNNTGTGILLTAKGTATITDNTILNNLHPDGIALERHTKGMKIEGVSESDMLGGSIARNTVSGNRYTGICVSDFTDGFIIEHNTVTGHNLHYDAAGIFLSMMKGYKNEWGHPEYCKNHIVRDNIVTGNIRGIIAYFAQESTIENNKVTVDSGTFDPGQEGIKLDGSNNIIVRNNDITGSDGTGIRVQNAWTGTGSCSNNIADNTITNVGFPGIKVSSNAHDNSFTGNSITGAHFAGIFIYGGAQDNTFTDNTINGTTILTLWAGEEWEETQGDGVFIDDDAGTGNVFHCNNIYGNAGDGMENQTATLVDAKYNWWGNASGPDGAQIFPPGPYTGVLPGTGDSVSANVSCMPWLTRPFATVLEDDIAYFGVSFPALKGWNIVSAPLALDANVNADGFTANTTTNTTNTWGGLINLGKKEGGDGYALKLHYTLKDGKRAYTPIYYYDPTFGWRQATDNTTINPVDAFYIRMMESDSFPVLFSPDLSVPSKKLYQGWNLVGCAYMDVMFADDLPLETALATIKTVSSPAAGDVKGYTQVVSPPVNQPPWIFIPTPEAEDGGIYIGEGAVGTILMGKGYWVFMENPGTLAGLTFTPISLGPPG